MVEPTQLKNMLVKMGSSSANFRGENVPSLIFETTSPRLIRGCLGFQEHIKKSHVQPFSSQLAPGSHCHTASRGPHSECVRRLGEASGLGWAAAVTVELSKGCWSEMCKNRMFSLLAVALYKKIVVVVVVVVVAVCCMLFVACCLLFVLLLPFPCIFHVPFSS